MLDAAHRENAFFGAALLLVASRPAKCPVKRVAIERLLKPTFPGLPTPSDLILRPWRSRRNQIRSRAPPFAAEPSDCSIAHIRRSNSLRCLHQGAPLPSWFLASDPVSRSCRGRWCAEPGDERQDLLEHLPRHRDLGHLERHVAAVADDL